MPFAILDKPNFVSLTNPHKILTTAVNSTLVLSSQYPCAKLTSHWSVENPQGICTFPLCQDHNLVESPEHILIHCPAYISTRLSMVLLCYKQKDPISHFLISKLLFTSNMMQLLLDCSALPLVIHNAQLHGEQVYNNLFYLSRTWCFALSCLYTVQILPRTDQDSMEVFVFDKEVDRIFSGLSIFTNG